MLTRLQQQTEEVVSKSRVDGGRSKCGDRGMDGWMDGWKNMDMDEETQWEVVWRVRCSQTEREREMDNGRSMQGNKKLKAAEIFIVWWSDREGGAPLAYLPSRCVQSLLTPPSANQPQAVGRAETDKLFTFLSHHLLQRILDSGSLPSCSASLHQCWMALLHTFANSSPISNHALVHILSHRPPSLASWTTPSSFF